MIERSNLGSAYCATATAIADHDWEREASHLTNLRKEFASFNEMYKAKVIHIKELRKQK